MKLTINLDDDWLQVPGYVPEGLLRAIKEHEAVVKPKLLLPTEEMLQRLVALTPS